MALFNFISHGDGRSGDDPQNFMIKALNGTGNVMGTSVNYQQMQHLLVPLLDIVIKMPSVIEKIFPP